MSAIGGCRPKPGAEEGSPPPAVLGVAALQTHARYVKAVNAGVQTPSDEIAPKYWAEEIKRLDPIKVYKHRWNIVVVQKTAPGREEGKYISTLISSYRPRSGEDGFTFTEIGSGVFDFTRTIGR
jgi:hypothetical protein